MDDKAFIFWKRVDSLLDGTIIDLCKRINLDYNRIKHNRSDCRIPKAEDIYLLARGLNVSMDFLYSGDQSEAYIPPTPQIKAIFDVILASPQAKLDLLYEMLVKEDTAETHKIKNQA